ncbi:uncharacterized protein LOC143540007 [Bidens hawaiensis]|uniref:uncharacterized protein LOC143540007 n=1 Tax=Bidens hawaiensis TaxID=980011 RepID=UPI00404AAC1D
MKTCELCSHIARIYCQSDNASLCYNCDQTVHSSNFLVAKHSRTLLCHKCHSPTPWTASGLNLGRAATVCVSCLEDDRSNDVVDDNNNNNNIEEEETDGDDDTESTDDDEDDDDTENQVVPWSSSVVSPPVNGSSSDEGCSSRSVTNRERVDGYIDSEDDSLCSSERCNGKRSTEIRLASFRPLKVIRSDG